MPFAAIATALLLLAQPTTTTVPATAPTSAPAGPERWLAEVERIEARGRDARPGRVLFVGSSSIRLWKTLATDLPDLDPLNHGIGGSRLDEVNHFFDRLVTPYAPRMVVLYAGENDLASGRSPRQVADAFRGFVGRVHALWPDVPVVFISIKPSPKRWAMADKFREANALVREVVDADPRRLSYVDVWPALLGPDGKPRPELFIDDQLHLNAAGYVLWTDVVGRHARERLPANRE